ncbi:Rod shape-determining protein MreB [Fusobacterium necrophorum subsp. necrophorum]|nr:Rod shape-determining protein MreB [Fusobacterium necrophorum subsp. necrophorum]
MFSDDIGIDLGTSNTLICVKNKGIILNEPSVVAIQSKTKEIYEVGERAKLMIGRTPQAYETIRPLKNGVIADYEITEKMLNSFYRRISNRLLYNPRVIICVPAGITQVEKEPSLMSHEKQEQGRLSWWKNRWQLPLELESMSLNQKEV